MLRGREFPSSFRVHTDTCSILTKGDATGNRIARAGVTTAETTLAASQAALRKLELVAPMAGAVVNVDLIAGQLVSPAQAVMSLVDFSNWYTETDNLTEMDVVNVTRGPKVIVVPDAIPGFAFYSLLQGCPEKTGQPFRVSWQTIFTVRVHPR